MAVIHLSMLKRYFNDWKTALKLQFAVRKRSRSITVSLFQEWLRSTKASIFDRHKVVRRYMLGWKRAFEIRKQQDALNRLSHRRKLLGQYFSFWRAAFLARQCADGSVSPFRLSSLQDLTREFSQSPSKGIPQIHSPALSAVSISSRPSSRSQSPYLSAIETHSSLSSRASSPNPSIFSLEIPRPSRSSVNQTQNPYSAGIRFAHIQLGNKLL
jgi:hypothetical protein